jgi:large repetitive protein
MRTLALLMLVACGDKDPDGGGGAVDTGEVTETDADGDGTPASEDCDDDDATVGPEATEVCDGVDNNCDGQVDEGLTTAFFADADADGFGDPGAAEQACTQPEGSVADDTDCDDTDAERNPGATEVCNALDDDCDGLVDDADDSLDLSSAPTWYSDADRDGFGDDANTTRSCVQPPDTADVGGDCDDDNHEAFPGDVEACNGIDDDCDGLIDDADPDRDETTGTAYYTDADGDGYGDATAPVWSCDAPSGTVVDDTDCDDAKASANPGADELCDGGTDEDCDGDIDEDDAADAPAWFPDMDEDGYGDSDSAMTSCDQPSGFIAVDGDCDDEDPDVSPDATELCDLADNDCDGTVDEDDAADAELWYADDDADGFGDAGATTTACSEPSGYTSDDLDCDDTDSSVYPWAGDAYGDGVDGDCDGLDCEADDTGAAYFAVCPGAADWADWRADCQDAGHDDLASIQDATEDAFVYQLLVDAGLSASVAPYIGYSDEIVEGSWGWSDGTTTTYTNWSSGEPNNSSNEDCAHLNWPLGTGSWNDTQCGSSGAFSGAVCGTR